MGIEARCSFYMKKKCQIIPPGTLNVFYMLVIHTDNAQVSLYLQHFANQVVLQLISPKVPKIKIGQHFYFKNLLLLQTSANEICLGCTILEL